MMYRAASALDIDEIARLAMGAFADVALSPPSFERARAIAAETIASGLALVVERDKRIVASMGLARRLWEHSGQAYLTDRWTYRDGSAHSPRSFDKLIHGARAVAGKLRLPLYLGITRHDPESAIRLYSLAGGKMVGALFEFPPEKG